MAIDAAHPVPPNLPRQVGLDQIPPHVPKELVRQSGLTTGAEFLANPHDFMAAMHEKWFGIKPAAGSAAVTIFPGTGVPGMPGYDATPREPKC